jgi:hypothetical protein
MTTIPPEASKPSLVSRTPNKDLKILAAIGLLLVGAIVSSNLGVFNQHEILKWKEQVLLPSGELIIVQRSEESGSDSAFGPMYWARESIEIPNPDPKEPPILWRSDSAQVKGVPHGAHALALYFEGSSPKLIAYDVVDAEYGCAFTNGLRLFSWTRLAGWRYDPYTRIHTHYVGPSNLYSWWDDRRLHDLIPKRNTLIGPKSSDALALRQNIDTQRERPNCSYPRPLSLTDILNGPKE